MLFSLTTTISYSQEIVTYDEEAQIFCIDIDNCDSCILGEEDSQVCNCRENCLGIADEFLIDCLQTANGLLDIQRCKDLASQRIHFCKEDCGTEPEWPYIDFILMSLSVQSAEIPFHPLVILNELESRGHAIEEGHHELINFYKFNDNCIDISDHDLSGLNYCFTYDISILIGESGSPERRECRYVGSHCIING